ncbi:hypothetical protein ACIRJR_23695 [Streptomyces sp. NPDC102402]|uniref:hypothetical protein n=1 Tax=Streptomyces sp. NPDC102402 TaxID=3366169 RepID=UPI00382449A5
MTVEINAFHDAGEPARRSGPNSATAAPCTRTPGPAESRTAPPAAAGPGAHDNPAQVAGTRDLMLAVARLAAAGLSAYAVSSGGFGERGRRAAYGG